MSMLEPSRFLADTMLGSLAKKLRLLGIDTAYSNDTDASELKYLARSQGRILLTRNLVLAKNMGELAWLVTGYNAREEFLSVANSLSAIDFHIDPFSRCLKCNNELVLLESSSVREKIPPYVLEAKESFYGCPSCERVYWEGTHRERMKEEVEWMKVVLQGEGRLD